MIRLYDDVKKIFNPLTSPTSSEELESEESEPKDMPPLKSEELETIDMPPESEKSDTEYLSPLESIEQKGQGVKILTPKQMLHRLIIILLAQLQAGNNSQKLKNEIRQLLHILYQSKKLSKTIYKSLMNTI